MHCIEQDLLVKIQDQMIAKTKMKPRTYLKTIFFLSYKKLNKVSQIIVIRIISTYLRIV